MQYTCIYYYNANVLEFLAHFYNRTLRCTCYFTQYEMGTMQLL